MVGDGVLWWFLMVLRVLAGLLWVLMCFGGFDGF